MKTEYKKRSIIWLFIDIYFNAFSINFIIILFFSNFRSRFSFSSRLRSLIIISLLYYSILFFFVFLFAFGKKACLYFFLCMYCNHIEHII